MSPIHSLQQSTLHLSSKWLFLSNVSHSRANYPVLGLKYMLEQDMEDTFTVKSKLFETSQFHSVKNEHNA